MTRPDLVIYHGNCPDGIASAWCYKHSYPDKNIKYHSGKFGEIPPDVSGLNVVFVDFTYTLDVMTKLLETANSIRVLDHHKSAEPLRTIKHDNFSLVLDMNRSGAQIAYDEVFNSGGNYEREWFIDYIADGDLWRWELPDSKAIKKGMFAEGYFKSLDGFTEVVDKFPTNNKPPVSLINLGNALLKNDEQIYSRLMARAIDCILHAEDDSGLTWKVRLVGCESEHTSEVGNRLAEDELCDFAVIFKYIPDKDEWWLSMRAKKETDVDLTEVVKHFSNGGGHPKASGMCIYGKNGHSLKTFFTPVPKGEEFHKITSYKKTIKKYLQLEKEFPELHKKLLTEVVSETEEPPAESLTAFLLNKIHYEQLTESAPEQKQDNSDDELPDLIEIP